MTTEIVHYTRAIEPPDEWFFQLARDLLCHTQTKVFEITKEYIIWLNSDQLGHSYLQVSEKSGTL